MFTKLVQYIIAGLLILPGVTFAAGAVQLPATNQTACFAGDGSVIPCFGTDQDGDNKAGVAWPAPRFTDNGNGTVTDKLTGLVWSKHANAPNRALPNASINGCLNAEKEMIWLDALDFIACLNNAGHAGSSDWRLPNLNELEGMVNAGVADSSVYLNQWFGFGAGPSQVRASQYWSSTSDAGDVAFQSAAAAWDVDLAGGDSFSSGKNELKRAVWPVRGVSTAPARLWRTGQALCFDDVGDSRPCAGTGEDGEKLAGAPLPAPRFKPNAGATFALDRVSGLIWTTDTQTPGSSSCADTGTGLNLTWQQALDHVSCLNSHAFLGRTDWRLPNRKELHSLADYSTGAPALATGHPFNDQDGNTYWSSTTNAVAPTEAWVVSMFDGSLSGAAKEGILPAWPVSGPDLVLPLLTIAQGNMTTNIASQTISGTVEAGATVTVTNNGGAPAAATVTGAAWSFTFNPLPAGANAITVTAADFSENPSTASLSITLDATAPPLAITPVTTRTNKKNQTIGGTVETGATVTVTMGGTTAPATVNGSAWSFPVTGLAAGANSITVTATDAVGNKATQVETITFVSPDGKLSEGSQVNVSDALKALRMAVGIVQPSADELLHGDVAPAGAPDDKIDVNDALLILRKAVGLPSF
jgi:hypothetical protein